MDILELEGLILREANRAFVKKTALSEGLTAVLWSMKV